MRGSIQRGEDRVDVVCRIHLEKVIKEPGRRRFIYCAVQDNQRLTSAHRIYFCLLSSKASEYFPQSSLIRWPLMPFIAINAQCCSTRDVATSCEFVKAAVSMVVFFRSSSYRGLRATKPPLSIFLKTRCNSLALHCGGLDPLTYFPGYYGSRIIRPDS